MGKTISHHGVVASVTNEKVCVQIVQSSACATCEAKGLCQSSESKEKMIEVRTPQASMFSQGEKVLLTGTLRMGMYAVLLAYVIPLILLVSIVLSVVKITGNEPLGAIVAIIVMSVYFLFLYANKRSLVRNFTFTIKHLK